MTASKTTFPQVQTHSAPGALTFVPLPSSAYIALADTIRIVGSENSIEEEFAHAVYDRIARLMGEDEPKVESNNDSLKSSSSSSFTWRYKNVRIAFDEHDKFKMYYKGEPYHFEVVNGKLRYQDKDYDEPGAVVKAITGTNRSAWRDVWVKRAGDKDWLLADKLRQDPINIDNTPKDQPNHPPLLFADALETIAELRRLGFPEDEKNLFSRLHHKNKNRGYRFNETMKSFEDYAKNVKRAPYDNNNGRVIRRLNWLVENSSGQNTDWEELVDKVVDVIPFKDEE